MARRPSVASWILQRLGFSQDRGNLRKGGGLGKRRAASRRFHPLVEPFEDRRLLSGLVSVSSLGSVTEGSPAGFMIQLSGMAAGTVTANWQTVPGTATAGDDFTAASGSVQLSEMMNFETIYIATLTDSVYDPDETFSVLITSVTGDATIGTPSSAQVTIEDSEPPGGGGGSEPTGISVASPGTLNEGDQFNLHVTLSPPGIYMVSGTVDWGDSPGMGSETFSGYTLSDGQIWLPHQYYDDGPTPGNDTSSDIETITVTVAGLVGTTNATIQNVAPAGSDFGLQDISSSSLAATRLNGEVLDVMPAGDSLEATIDWGDESTPQVINGSSMLNLSVEHIYPVPWKSYTVAVTVRDDDLGIYSWTGAVFVDPPDPTGDLQIRYPGLAAISDDDELDPGGFPLVENDTQLVTLHLSPAMNSFPDAKYALEYGAGSITLWKDEALTDPVVSTTALGWYCRWFGLR
jgi:hypothetical protein